MMSCLPYIRPKPMQQSGLSLLEIMITVVILSLGLLGMASLQLTGLKNNRDAYYGSQANQKMQAMAELIRSDTTNMRKGDYDALGCAEGEKKCTGLCAKDAVNCPMSQQWLSEVASVLPSGAGRVREAPAGSNTFLIAVLWTDPQLNGTMSWGVDTATNPATSACGDAVVDRRCLYIRFQP